MRAGSADGFSPEVWRVFVRWGADSRLDPVHAPVHTPAPPSAPTPVPPDALPSQLDALPSQLPDCRHLPTGRVDTS